MRIPPLLAILAAIPAAAQVSPIASSEVKDVIPAFSPSGPITLRALHIQLNINYPRGKKEHGDLTVVYDPRTGTICGAMGRFDQQPTPTPSWLR